jgi:transcriptional regulator of acetoin/glycerol metabolism
MRRAAWRRPRHGNEAARILGIDRSTIHAKRKAYGLEEKDEQAKNDE